MPTAFGWFVKGGVVRRATSPTHAVTLRSQGWQVTDAPSDVQVEDAPVPDTSLQLEAPEQAEPVEDEGSHDA